MSFLEAPRPVAPRAPSTIDGVVVGVFALATIAEGVLRPALVMRPLQIGTTLIVVFALLFRTRQPLGALAVACGVTIAAGVVKKVWGFEPTSLYAHACLLLFPYSLVRWGSGRDVVMGLALVVGVYAVSAWQGEMRNAEEVIGSAVVLLFPGALGAAVRFRAEAQRRAIETAQAHERTRIARELHDTVAHHVAAIAIQAQGGRAVLATKPEAAARALSAIEEEATKALAELRTMVSSLRDEAATLADLEKLARTDEPRVVIERVGALDQLSPSVQAGVYRMAQESITNALRHAKKPTVIRVRVAAEGDAVRLTVRDDGERSETKRGDGFGLVGMAERAALLGGTLAAGPADEGGWLVDASLPRGAR